MKIGVMMRAMDQDSGFRSHIEGLIENMLRIDEENSYLLFYRSGKWFGRFAGYKNVEELLLGAPHKFVWDQVAVPYRAWREGADIIFNPKFSVPLVSHCPVAMGLQEPGWWIWPQHYEWFDANYNKMMLPLCIRKSAHLFSWSDFVLKENQKILRIHDEKVTISYTAASTHFRPINDTSTLETCRNTYRLPKKYILCVTRVDHPGLDKPTSFHSGKNPETALRAFMLCRDEIPHELLFVGRRVRDYMSYNGFRGDDFRRVQFLGFVPHEELAGIYNLADIVVFPSLYEGFGVTLLEAMACGGAIVASRTGASPEVSGGATLLADPHDPVDFADKIRLILRNEELRNDLKSKGLKRATFFNWERTARLTLQGLIQAVRNHAHN